MKLRLALAVLTTVILAGATAPAHAQGGAPTGARPPAGGAGGMGNQQRMTEMLFQGITLTADQQTQIKAVDEKFKPRLDAMREEMRAAMQGGAPNPELRTKMTTLNDEQRAALRAVLTADQQKQFDENIAKMPQRGGRGGRPPAPAV